MRRRRSYILALGYSPSFYLKKEKEGWREFHLHILHVSTHVWNVLALCMCKLRHGWIYEGDVSITPETGEKTSPDLRPLLRRVQQARRVEKKETLCCFILCVSWPCRYTTCLWSLENYSTSTRTHEEGHTRPRMCYLVSLHANCLALFYSLLPVSYTHLTLPTKA